MIHYVKRPETIMFLNFVTPPEEQEQILGGIDLSRAEGKKGENFSPPSENWNRKKNIIYS